MIKYAVLKNGEVIAVFSSREKAYFHRDSMQSIDDRHSKVPHKYRVDEITEEEEKPSNEITESKS